MKRKTSSFYLKNKVCLDKVLKDYFLLAKHLLFSFYSTFNLLKIYHIDYLSKLIQEFSV